MSSRLFGVVVAALLNRQRRWCRHPAGTAMACGSALSAYTRSADNRERNNSTTVRLRLAHRRQCVIARRCELRAMLKPQRGQLRYVVLELDAESVVRWGPGESPTDPPGLRRSSGTSLEGRMTSAPYACIHVLTIQVNTPTPTGCLEPVLHVRRGLRRSGTPIVQPRWTGHDGCFRIVQVFWLAPYQPRKLDYASRWEPVGLGERPVAGPVSDRDQRGRAESINGGRKRAGLASRPAQGNNR